MMISRRWVYFNSRPSARGDLARCLDRYSREYFNSRPSARGDRPSVSSRSHPAHFNSRPSARGDHGCRIAHKKTRISIHAPPRGATPAVLRVVFLPFVFQFTPLREGRPGVFGSRRQCPRISIHAPPRGATPPAGVHPAGSPISIHAPPRGATTTTARACSSPTYFNSRPSARGDRPPAGVHPAGTPISIHAPPRGATGKRYAISANLLFNPYKSAWLNNSATQFVEIILVIFHRIIA